MLQTQSLRIEFPQRSGGPQEQQRTVAFNGNVRTVALALGGFDIGYNNSDHHLLRQRIDSDVLSVNANVVVVRVTFSLRDDSGTFDDPYSGYVDLVLVADTF